MLYSTPSYSASRSSPIYFGSFSAPVEYNGASETLRFVQLPESILTLDEKSSRFSVSIFDLPISAGTSAGNLSTRVLSCRAYKNHRRESNMLLRLCNMERRKVLSDRCRNALMCFATVNERPKFMTKSYRGYRNICLEMRLTKRTDLSCKTSAAGQRSRQIDQISHTQRYIKILAYSPCN